MPTWVVFISMLSVATNIPKFFEFEVTQSSSLSKHSHPARRSFYCSLTLCIQRQYPINRVRRCSNVQCKTRKQDKEKTKYCLKQCEFCVYLDNSFDKSGLWSIGGLIGQGGPGESPGQKWIIAYEKMMRKKRPK